MSEDHSECEHSEDQPEEVPEESGREHSIAVDPMQEVQPVRMVRALQATINAVSSHAETIIRNEKKAKIEKDGVLQRVHDEGGRQVMKSLILDVQETARSFDENVQVNLERAIASHDRRFTVCPMALAIPTQQPMDSIICPVNLGCLFRGMVVRRWRSRT